MREPHKNATAKSEAHSRIRLLPAAAPCNHEMSLLLRAPVRAPLSAARPVGAPRLAAATCRAVPLRLVGPARPSLGLTGLCSAFAGKWGWERARACCAHVGGERGRSVRLRARGLPPDKAALRRPGRRSAGAFVLPAAPPPTRLHPPHNAHCGFALWLGVVVVAETGC